MTVKTTYEKIVGFSMMARIWFAKDKSNENTKLGYALTKMDARLQKIQQKYNNRRVDIQIDNCATDEKGLILKDERGEYRFDKAGLKKCNEELQTLFESEVEIEPYFATQVPDSLTEAEREAFTGFVLEKTQSAEA